MLRNLALFLAAIIVAAILWRYFGAESGQRPQRPAPAVVLFEVKPKTLKQTLEAIGTANAKESVIITSSASDLVEAIHFEEGQWVNKGDKLVTLNQAEEQAQLAAAKIQLAEQKREYRRIENLVKQKSVSASELDKLQSAVDIAKAQVDQAQAKINDRIIRAPFSGKLGLRNISVGTLINPNDAITTLDMTKIMNVDFEMAERYLAEIKTEQAISARTSAYPNMDFVGAIKTIDSRIDSATRSIKVRATINNERDLIRSGMLMTLNIVSGEKTALLVPEEAVFMRGSQHFVYSVDQELTVSETAINIGLRQSGLVEVVEGLKDGDRIVHQGLLKVRPGAKVSTQTEEWRKKETASGEESNTSGAHS